MSVSEKEAPVDFARLNPEEQQAVAQRLQRIAESGWKPFWCRNRTCAGDPHPLFDAEGAPVEVDDDALAGANGEPVGDVFEDTRTGEVRVVLDPRRISTTEVYVGRVALDRQWAHNHARADQHLPGWAKPWILMVLSGRGTGKTRTGTEFVTLCARRGLNGAIIGRRGDELTNTHVAELIANAHPEFVPVYKPSKNLIEWPNGAITYLFSAERPENIRSVNLSYFWMDEAAFMDEVSTAWMNARLATRIETPGNPIHILITSTPTGTKWVIEKEDDPDIEVRRVSTYANRANLSPDYIEALEKEYEGTRMGRQELHGEVLRDVPGALWNDGMFVQQRCDASEFADLLDTMDDIVVAVDPAGSANKRSDETGIVAVGVQRTDDAGQPLSREHYFVLADGTLKGTPSEWATAVYKVARTVGANRIIAEKNFGGEMVKQVLTDHIALHPEEGLNELGVAFPTPEVVHASEGKETRAESTVNKYEQSRVTHVTWGMPGGMGDLSALEKEQVTWVPKSRGGRAASPNRIDATVWGVRALESAVNFPATMATGKTALRKLRRVSTRQVQPGLNTGPVGPRGRGPLGGSRFRGIRSR